LTNVPFVDSRSCTQAPSPRTSIRAWRPDANSSPVSTRSFCPPRPTVTGAELSGNSAPSSRLGLRFTTSRTDLRARFPRPSPAAAAAAGVRIMLSWLGASRSRPAERITRTTKR
jgi:hypothetical protein